MALFSGSYFPARQNCGALMVFLHGYNNSRQEMLPVYQNLLASCPNLSICAPEGRIVSDSDENRHSWYKISGFDHNGLRRKEETPIEEIVRIYDKTGHALCAVSQELNDYIDEIQNKYGFTDEQTYIAGFSQGGMLALWTALRRRHKIAACFCFSSFAAAADELEKKICSKPPVYLFHGGDDHQVRPKCMDYTLSWLERAGIETKAYAFDVLGHRIDERELDIVAEVINTRSMLTNI